MLAHGRLRADSETLSGRGGLLLHFSFPSQLEGCDRRSQLSFSLPALCLSLPAVAAQKNPKAGKELQEHLSHPGLCFSILERCSSNLSITAPSNGESTTFPARILPSGKAKVVLAPRGDPQASCSLCTWGHSLALS